MRFDMPSNLNWEEQKKVYGMLFDLKESPSVIGQIVWYLGRAWIHLTGFIPHSAFDKISTIPDEHLHLILDCFRQNQNLAKDHTPYLKEFSLKKFKEIELDDLLGDPYNLICKVCKQGNSLLFKETLKILPKNIQLEDRSGLIDRSPLILATRHNQKEIVIDLVNHYHVTYLTSFNCDDRTQSTYNSSLEKTTALKEACKYGHFEIIKFFLTSKEWKSTHVFEAVIEAIKAKKLSIPQYMSLIDDLSKRPGIISDEQIKEILKQAILADRFDLFKELLTHTDIQCLLSLDLIRTLYTELINIIDNLEEEKSKTRAAFFALSTWPLYQDQEMLKAAILNSTDSTCILQLISQQTTQAFLINRPTFLLELIQSLERKQKILGRSPEHPCSGQNQQVEFYQNILTSLKALKALNSEPLG
jgi:hypothetical protein